jgi:hypothetical protein
MTHSNTVIGFFAYRSRAEVVCVNVDACLIAGSEEAMRTYLDELGGSGSTRPTIRKTRFGEIIQGMRLGASYAFDEAAYARFYPLARDIGLPVSVADFSRAKAAGDRFFTVQIAGGGP